MRRPSRINKVFAPVWLTTVTLAISSQYRQTHPGVVQTDAVHVFLASSSADIRPLFVTVNSTLTASAGTKLRIIAFMPPRYASTVEASIIGLLLRVHFLSIAPPWMSNTFHNFPECFRRIRRTVKSLQTLITSRHIISRRCQSIPAFPKPFILIRTSSFIMTYPSF